MGWKSPGIIVGYNHGLWPCDPERLCHSGEPSIPSTTYHRTRNEESSGSGSPSVSESALKIEAYQGTGWLPSTAIRSRFRYRWRPRPRGLLRIAPLCGASQSHALRGVVDYSTGQESGTHTMRDYSDASGAGLRLKSRPLIFALNPSKRHLTCGSASAVKQLPPSLGSPIKRLCQQKTLLPLLREAFFSKPPGSQGNSRKRFAAASFRMAPASSPGNRTLHYDLLQSRLQWSEIRRPVASTSLPSARPLSLLVMLYPFRGYASVTHVD